MLLIALLAEHARMSGQDPDRRHRAFDTVFINAL